MPQQSWASRERCGYVFGACQIRCSRLQLMFIGASANLHRKQDRQAGCSGDTVEHYDAIVIEAGLAGLVTTAELGDAGKRTLILEQEGGDYLGGQPYGH
jgi:heterodisulfide reductase subunit A-like polyferredoxin